MSTVNHLEAEQLVLGLCLTSAVLEGRGGRAAAQSHPIHTQTPTPHLRSLDTDIGHPSWVSVHLRMWSLLACPIFQG